MIFPSCFRSRAVLDVCSLARAIHPKAIGQRSTSLGQRAAPPPSSAGQRIRRSIFGRAKEEAAPRHPTVDGDAQRCRFHCRASERQGCLSATVGWVQGPRRCLGRLFRRSLFRVRDATKRYSRDFSPALNRNAGFARHQAHRPIVFPHEHQIVLWADAADGRRSICRNPERVRDLPSSQRRRAGGRHRAKFLWVVGFGAVSEFGEEYYGSGTRGRRRHGSPGRGQELSAGLAVGAPGRGREHVKRGERCERCQVSPAASVSPCLPLIIQTDHSVRSAISKSAPCVLLTLVQTCRRTVLNLYTKLHSAGIVHNDVDWRHVLAPRVKVIRTLPSGHELTAPVKLDRIRLIDFGRAKIRSRADDGAGTEMLGQPYDDATWSKLCETEILAVETMMDERR